MLTDFEEDVEIDGADGNNNSDQPETHGANVSMAATIARATKRFRSQCCKEYVPILEDGVVVQGKCKHCEDIIGAKRGSGTSALLTHLRRCRKRSRALRIVEDLSSTLRSPCGSRLKDWSYDPDVSRYHLMRMISLHGLPFLVTEYDGLRSFVESLNPLFKMPCRTTARNGCMKAFQEMKAELKDIFKNENCRFSLTADMWTSNQTLGYIVVTCHFVDANWKLQKRIIKFLDVKTPHTGMELFNQILNCVQDWSIEDKLFGITLDNAAANNTMAALLKKNLVDKKYIPADGDLLHHRCAGHVFNLIVKDGLTFVEPIVEDIRESIKYIRSSQSRKQMFKEIVARLGITSKKKPGLDVTTRWNSMLSMLEAAIKFRAAFDTLKSEDQKYTYAPSAEQWTRAEVLCKVLAVFKDATEVISGIEYPTSNLYFHHMWKIKLTLEQESNIEVAEIANVLEGMKKKFKKYWRISYILLAVPVVFDPRFKLKFLEFLFTKSYPNTGKQKIDEVKKLVLGLFSSYSTQQAEQQVKQAENAEKSSVGEDVWAAWDQQLLNDRETHMATELDRYLEESPIPRSEEFDILKWWMGNSLKYPTLARIARDLLAVPASAVASESAFSTGKKIISDHRSSLAPEMVEALICTQDWYRAAAGTLISNMLT